MSSDRDQRPRLRLLREPTLHFFALGALLFLAHRWLVGNPRVIEVSAGLRADLERRAHDQLGRTPSPAELAAALESWKREEALYREALRERLDRDDATVRTVLADKLRARLAQWVPKRAPSEAEIDAWLGEHRADYATPLRYVFESVAFPKAQPGAVKARADYDRAVRGGARPPTLGRPILSGSLTRDDLTEKFGAALAASICAIPPGAWLPLETPQDLLLVHLERHEGGLPDEATLRPRLVADLMAARNKAALDQAVDEIVGRYRFEETK